jgi:type IV pilus assembly protein PilC
MRFVDHAKDTNGSLKSGELNCDSQEAATTQLGQQGLFVVSLEEVSERTAISGSSLFAKPITRRDIVEFASQLVVIVDAGVPIVAAIEGLAGQTDNPSMKSQTINLQKRVEAGDVLSIALAKYPKYFDKAFINLFKASEVCGQLGTMLEQIATQYRTESEMRIEDAVRVRVRDHEVADADPLAHALRPHRRGRPTMSARIDCR